MTIVKNAAGIPVRQEEAEELVPADFPMGDPFHEAGVPEVPVVATTADDPPPPVTNGPITWGQLLGGMISDFLNPPIMLAMLGVIANWLQSSEPVTVRGVVTVLVLAIISAYQVVLHATNSDGLARRMQAMGQLKQ